MPKSYRCMNSRCPNYLRGMGTKYCPKVAVARGMVARGCGSLGKRIRRDEN